MKIPFLRTGSFTDMNNKKVEFKDEAALDTVLLATKEREYDKDEIPIVIGHPKTDSPAFGWVKKDKLFREGNTLYALAEEDQVTDELKDLLKKKMFKKVSPKIYKDGSIAHIGLLGAIAPAIKGLPSYSFSSEEEGSEISVELAELELSQWSFNIIKKLFRSLKKYLIEKEGIEKADQLISDYDIDEAGEVPKIIEKKTSEAASFSEPETNDQNKNKLKDDEMEKVIELEAQLAEKDTALTEANRKLKELADKQAADLLAAKTAEFTAFCERDEVKLKIKDGEKDEIVNTLLALDKVDAFEFGEGDEKKTVNAVDVVKTLIVRLPNIIDPGEKFRSETAADNPDAKDEVAELAEAIEKIVDEENKAGRKISFAEAASKVKSKKQ